ncbi:MAG: calcium/sodium antiporter [Planctomycetes bacterium]|nr:calcium/sodium antiporter [Planctomycetota bacterium]
MLIPILLLLGGLVVLTGGAELLVRGASRLATAFGVSALVVGLTVVAFGTSAPELVVSVTSVVAGQGDIALGNVVGSNIFNILFILGVSAVITPLAVAQKLVRIDTPIMIGVALLAGLFALDGQIGRWDGIVLALGLAAFVVFCIRHARRESPAVTAEYEREHPATPKQSGNLWTCSLGILVGLALLVAGSKMFVSGAVDIAKTLGVSDLVIGLTIVAAGTSLPEVATSIMAALRGERDIAVGNVVGSNIFNVLGVLGVSAVVAPDSLGVSAAALRFDIPVMIATSLACVPIFMTGFTIARWEGALFLAYYGAYTTYLVLDASDHDALPAFSRVMLLFVVPLSVLGLGVGVVRTLRRERALERLAGVRGETQR